MTGRDPAEDYRIMNSELQKFSPELGEKPQLVVLNKIDITEARKKAQELDRYFSELGVEVSIISAVTGEGIEDLIYRIADSLEEFRNSSDEQSDYCKVSE